MAVVKGPLMSMDASGTIAGSIVFSKWKGRPYVRRHAIPANPRSALQMGVRNVFKFVAQDWSNLSPGAQAKWEALAASEQKTGLNMMIALAVAAARAGLGWPTEPDATPAATVQASADVAVTPGYHEIAATWTDPVTSGTLYACLVYAKNGSAPTGMFSELVGVVPAGQQAFTLPGLTTGDTWHLGIKGLDIDSVLGALSNTEDGLVT